MCKKRYCSKGRKEAKKEEGEEKGGRAVAESKRSGRKGVTLARKEKRKK